MQDITSFQGEHRFLSNFWPLEQPVNFEGLDFFTTEAAYVAAKTIDIEERKKIQQMTPGKAKRHGEKIFEHNISPNPVWSDSFKLNLMRDLVFQKFSKNLELREKLLETGEGRLIEGNTWHDNFFGICTCGNCPPDKQQLDPKNHLGNILMEVREQLQSKG